jgi:transformation/transcription domain-associated protein
MLGSALTLWPDASIKYAFLDKQFATPAAAAPAGSGGAPAADGSGPVLTGLAVLHAITKRQPAFLLRHLKQVHALLTPAFEQHIELPKMVDALQSFLHDALRALAVLSSRGSVAVQAELASFLEWLGDACGGGLGGRDPQPSREINVVRTHGSLRLLSTVGKAAPGLISKHHTLLTKMLARLTKEYLTRREAQPSPAASPSPDELLLPSLKLTISLGARKLPEHGDARKAFLLSLERLIERAADTELLLLLLRTVGPWVVAPAGAPPALLPKERASMMLKLSAVESTGSPELHALLLALADRVLAAEALPGRELLLSPGTMRMETPLLLGLRSRSPSTRRTFSSHLSAAIGRTVAHRVTHVVAGHDTDGSAGLGPLWIRSAAQVLLSAAEPDGPVQISGPALALPALTIEKAGPGSASGSRIGGAAAKIAADVASFLSDCARKLSLGELLAPLAELLHDPTAGSLAHDVWVSLFPQAWRQLSFDEQLGHYKPLLATLQRPVNLKYAHNTPNPVEGWLAAISACSPAPKLPAALLRHLASRFGAWHLATPLLEASVALHPTETQWYDALADVHSALGDADARAAVCQQRALHHETRRALALGRYGAWQAAQDAYAECMNRWQAGEIVLVNTPQAELALWEEGIISSAKALNQWELLSEYAKTWPGSQPALLMECAWKSADWERLRDLFGKANLRSQASLRMLQTYAAIHDGKLGEAEARCNEGMQYALAQWCALPPPALPSHTPLLQMFQQFQELQESAQMLVELNAAQRNNQLPDLSSILLTWRERLPNAWEALPAWNDLVSWRNHMFSHINNVLGRLAGPDNPALATKGYQELLWTVVRFAHVARRQQLPQACVSIIAKVQTVTAGLASSDLDDAFSKLREQARACLQLPGSRKQGLQALLAADVTHMSSAQRAELFIIKGELLLAMADAGAAAAGGGPSPAEEEAVSTAFATAVSIHPDLPRGWLLWGFFYDRTYRDLLAAKGPTPMDVDPPAGGTPAGAAPTSALVAAAAERALTCYLLSLQLSAAKGASIVPRVLTLLDAVAGPVAARALGDNAEGIPLWHWLPWLPQLLRGLRKGWGPQAQHLLTRIAEVYPQPLYYPLRAYLASSGVGVASPPDVWRPVVPVKTPTAAAPAAAPAVAAASAPAAAAAAAAPAAALSPAAATPVPAVPPADAAPTPTAVPPPVAPSPSITTSVIKQESVATDPAAMIKAEAPAAVKMEPPASQPDVTMTEAPPIALAPAPAILSPAKPPASPAVFPPSGAAPPDAPPPSFENKGVASRILASLRSEHPRLTAQVDSLCDALESSLLPTLSERLLAAIHDVIALALGAPPSPPDTPPAAVLDALKAIDRHFGFSSGAAARTTSVETRALAAGWGATLVRECVASPPPVLSELLARLDAIRGGLSAELASRPRTAQLEPSCWRLLLSQQPLVEIPGQYATSDCEPIAPETHELIDRLEERAVLTRDPATGETQRRLTLISDSLTRHTFHLRAPSPLRPHDALGVERLSQLVRLLNRRLLCAREARRRGLALFLPLALRLGRGVMLCASDTSAVSLASVLHSARSAAGLQPHGPALTHQRTLSRGVAPPDEEARRERLRQAFGDACRGVPDDLLTHAVQDSLPDAVQQWELRRTLTSQLGMHALLCHALGLRALQPASLVFSLASGDIALGAFDTPALPPPHGAPPAAPLPFRLTRNLQRLATPFGIDGAFSAAFCAAAECFAHSRKCPLELWLTALAAPEEDGATGAHIQFLPPWTAPPAAAAARARELSPAELVSKMGKEADVHAALRALVAEATSDEALARQPPAWQAWL